MSLSKSDPAYKSSGLRLLGIAKLLLPTLIFAGVLFVLYRLIHEYNYHTILNEVRSIDRQSIVWAFLFCAANYAVLAGYDALALLYVGKSLPFSKTALTAFISYTISQNVGLSVVSGGAIRYRLYSRWGMSAAEIGQIIIFASFHFWVGLFLLGGITCMVKPDVFASVLHLSRLEVWGLGSFMFAAIGLYFLASARGATISFRGREFKTPRLSLVTAALFVSSLDWLLASTVLFVLLPGHHEVGFLQGLATFLAAQMLGVLSHVPGGLGVFETVVVYLLSPVHRASAVLGALLVFRLVYYIVPFAFGVLTLVSFEIRAKLLASPTILEKLRPFQALLAGIIPRLLAIAIFIAGAVLLFSGALPTAHDRLWWVSDIVPLPVVETSHFINSIIGILLLVLANGIRRRLSHAYILAVFLLSGGVVISLVKGLDYEEATYLLVVLALLFMSKEYFRRSPKFHWRIDSLQVLLVLGVLLAVGWLGMFAYKHQEYSSELWWQFAGVADAPRFLRAMVVMAVLFVGIGARSILKIRAPREALPSAEEVNHASTIVKNCTETSAQLALLGDKHFLWSENKNAFVMFRTNGRSWVAMGDPVGPEAEMEELIWQFRELADDHEGYCVFYEVAAKNLPIYLDIGLKPYKIGEQAILNLEKFSLDGPIAKNFRYTLNKFEREGYCFRILPVESARSIMEQLRSISDWWLEDKGAREKGFSLGFFSEKYLRHCPIALVCKEDNILAFANLWCGTSKEEVSIDLMRYGPDSPNGIMDFLFLSLFRWAKSEGFKSFNLGMAPLSGIEARPLSPLWAKIGAYVYRHGDQFYSFEGLRRYKEKFHPDWEPRYLMVSSSVALPLILSNVTSLISENMQSA